MSERTRSTYVRLIISLAWLALMVAGGWQLYAHRHYEEPVVLGPGVTGIVRLSDYSTAVEGTINDCNIYVLDSGKPGGTMLVLGGAHPEEPGAMLAAYLLVETARVTSGRVLVAVRPTRSASTVTRPGDAYPLFFNIKTPWGEQRFRMGDRWANPLDSWPDPEVYINYPSGQMLAYMDVRNLNRTWPGRENGMLSERTCYAFIQLIKEEKVDVVFDLHEAELEYPVISTIVAHQRAADITALASMILSAEQFPIGMENSPTGLHGLAHREVGDFTDAFVFQPEAPEPFLDRVRGVTDEKLLLTGQDEFVQLAGEHKLLYEKIDDNGWPIDVRVGRHASTIDEVSELFSEFYPDRTIVIEDLPHYQDVIDNGLGSYLANPETAPKDRVSYN